MSALGFIYPDVDIRGHEESVCSLGQRQLVDTLLEILEEILQRQSLHWTLEAASVIVVLAEVLFGTSIQSENLGAGNDAQTSDQGVSLSTQNTAVSKGMPSWVMYCGAQIKA